MGAVASRGRTTAPAALARCMLVRRVYRCGVVLLNELALLPSSSFGTRASLPTWREVSSQIG